MSIPINLQDLDNRALTALMINNQQRIADLEKIPEQNFHAAKRLLSIFDFGTEETPTVFTKKLHNELAKLMGIKFLADEIKAIKQAIYHKALKSISVVIAEFAADEFIKAEQEKTVVGIRHLNTALMCGDVGEILVAMKNIGVYTDNIKEHELATILMAQQLLDRKIDFVAKDLVINEIKDLEIYAAKLEITSQNAVSLKVRELAMEKLQGLKIRIIELNKKL